MSCRAPLRVEGLEGGEAEQQPVQLQRGGREREAVGARGAGVELFELRRPARAPRPPVPVGLRAHQLRHQLQVYVVQFAPHDPYDVGGLPAAAPGRCDELLASAGEFGVGGGSAASSEAPVSRAASLSA